MHHGGGGIYVSETFLVLFDFFQIYNFLILGTSRIWFLVRKYCFCCETGKSSFKHDECKKDRIKFVSLLVSIMYFKYHRVYQMNTSTQIFVNEGILLG